MKLLVQPMPPREVYRDMVRLPEQYRKDSRQAFVKEGKICKVSVAETGCTRFVAVRGKQNSAAAEIYMDEITREELKVELGRIYDFEFRTGLTGRIRWVWSASDPAYRLPGQIAIVSLILGLLGLALGALSIWLALHPNW